MHSRMIEGNKFGPWATDRNPHVSCDDTDTMRLVNYNTNHVILLSFSITKSTKTKKRGTLLIKVLYFFTVLIKLFSGL